MKQVKLNKIKKAKVKLHVKPEKKVLIFIKHLFHLNDEQKEIKLSKKKFKQYKKLKLMRVNEKEKKQKLQNHSSNTKKIKQSHFTPEQLILKYIKDLFNNFRQELNIADFSLYSYSRFESNIIKHLAGKVETDLIAEKYLSFSKTTILVNPEGLQDDDTFKSRIILQLSYNNIHYLIVFSSYAMETFKAEKLAYIIHYLKHIKRKVGDETYEHGADMQQKIPQTV